MGIQRYLEDHHIWESKWIIEKHRKTSTVGLEIPKVFETITYSEYIVIVRIC